VIAADQNAGAAEAAAMEAQTLSSADMTLASPLDLSAPDSIASAIRSAVLTFGGVDIIVNTAAVYPTPSLGASTSESMWARTLQINVTGNYVLVDQLRSVFTDQNLSASIVFTSSANAVVAK